MYVLSFLRSHFTNFFWKGTVYKKKGARCQWCNGRHIRRNSRNIVDIGKNSTLTECIFFINGSNNIITIGDNCNFNEVSFWIKGDNNHIIIGDGTTVGRNTEFAALEGTNIYVGKDCMFSHDIRLRTSDSHSMLNEMGERINPAKDIVIGNHVWIGMYGILLKGTSIGDNSVVAARAVVSKTFSENNLIAGMPAKIIKERINWSRKMI